MRYCIGDIHACYKTLVKLVDIIMKKDQDAKLYFVGDYIDRGPGSKQVLDYLMILEEKKILLGSVRGNHEQMLLECYDNQQSILGTVWQANKGMTTLKSFSDSADVADKVNSIVPDKYYHWISSLPYYIELDDYLIVHGGFNFYSSEPFNDFYSMIWTREECYDEKKVKGKKIVHGHSTVQLDMLKNKLLNKEKIINIDTGCVYVQHTGFGYLTALCLDNLELTYVKNIDIN